MEESGNDNVVIEIVSTSSGNAFQLADYRVDALSEFDLGHYMTERNCQEIEIWRGGQIYDKGRWKYVGGHGDFSALYGFEKNP